MLCEPDSDVLETFLTHAESVLQGCVLTEEVQGLKDKLAMLTEESSRVERVKVFYAAKEIQLLEKTYRLQAELLAILHEEVQDTPSTPAQKTTLLAKFPPARTGNMSHRVAVMKKNVHAHFRFLEKYV
jgi:hypothetical protein